MQITRSRAIWYAVVALLAVSTFALAVAVSVRYAATSSAWIERGFDRFDAPRRTGLPSEEVKRIGAEVRQYLVDDSELLTVSVEIDGNSYAFFSEREVLHMVDVKVLMQRVWDAGWAAFGFLLAAALYALWRWRRGAAERAARAALASGSLVTVLVVVLAALAMTGFDEAFRQFHLLFFTNDLWQLTSRDGLIQLFPQGFFFETTLLIGGAILLAAVLPAALGRLYLMRRERR